MTDWYVLGMDGGGEEAVEEPEVEIVRVVAYEEVLPRYLRRIRRRD